MLLKFIKSLQHSEACSQITAISHIMSLCNVMLGPACPIPATNMHYEETLETTMANRWSIRPGATGGHSGAVPPQMTACAPPSEDCVPKKLTGSGLLECKSRPKTTKLVLIVLEFASKNCFIVVFVDSHRIS